jgi:putative tricarboxylic transport membrane protein
MAYRDVAAGIGLMILAFIYWRFASAIPVSPLDDTIGAGGLPTTLATILGILAASLVLRGGWQIATSRAIPIDREHDRKRVGLPSRAAMMVVLGAGYLLLVSTLGYVVTIAALIMSVALFLGIGWSWRVPAVAAGGAAVLWLIFVFILDIPQPPGLWEGLL